MTESLRRFTAFPAEHPSPGRMQAKVMCIAESTDGTETSAR